MDRSNAGKITVESLKQVLSTALESSLSDSFFKGILQQMQVKCDSSSIHKFIPYFLTFFVQNMTPMIIIYTYTCTYSRRLHISCFDQAFNIDKKTQAEIVTNHSLKNRFTIVLLSSLCLLWYDQAMSLDFQLFTLFMFSCALEYIS